jgi:hypothetical protein
MASRITCRGVARVAAGCCLAGCLLAVHSARSDDVEGAARRAAARDVRALGWLVEEGLRAVLAPGEPPVDQRVHQRAEQMTRFFSPMLESELELVRRTCGGLDRTARRTVLAAGSAAVEEAAKAVAQRQLGGRAGDEVDPRAIIRAKLAESLAGVADPEELAAYRREVGSRAVRRDQSERLLIVARLDRQLDLTAAQRRAIDAALEAAWEPDWGRVVREHGTRRINNYPLAPDEAAAAISPHLDPDQLTEWENWCRAAGSDMTPNHIHWSFDGQGLQQRDPWWGQ